MYKIGERVDIITNDDRADFDLACRTAMSLALNMFDCDEAGYLHRVEDYRRNMDSIEIELVYVRISGGMQGWQYTYKFQAWVERSGG